MGRCSRIYHRLRIYSPAIIIISLIIFIYSVYIFNYVFVLVDPSQDITLFNSLYFSNYFYTHRYGLGLFFIVNILFILMIISFFRTAFMDPGYFPDPVEIEYSLIKKNLDFPENLKINSSTLIDDTHYEAKRKKLLNNFHQFIDDGPLTSSESGRHIDDINKYLSAKYKSDSGSDICLSIDRISATNDVFDNFQGYDLSKIILCNFCLRWKIMRSHHCKQCGKCVLKMDHHCPWVANCIGFRNHKYFCLLIIYGFLTSLLIFLTFWEVVLIVNTGGYNILLGIMYSFMYVSNFGLLCFMTYLLNANYYLVMTNQTVIEKADRDRFGTAKFNFYDKGKYHNFKSVFGDNILFWFLPFNPNYKGKGIIFY
jgi:hypothetical protein